MENKGGYSASEGYPICTKLGCGYLALNASDLGSRCSVSEERCFAINELGVYNHLMATGCSWYKIRDDRGVEEARREFFSKRNSLDLEVGEEDTKDEDIEQDLVSV